MRSDPAVSCVRGVCYLHRDLYSASEKQLRETAKGRFMDYFNQQLEKRFLIPGAGVLLDSL